MNVLIVDPWLLKSCCCMVPPPKGVVPILRGYQKNISRMTRPEESNSKDKFADCNRFEQLVYLCCPRYCCWIIAILLTITCVSSFAQQFKLPKYHVACRSNEDMCMNSFPHASTFCLVSVQPLSSCAVVAVAATHHIEETFSLAKFVKTRLLGGIQGH